MTKLMILASVDNPFNVEVIDLDREDSKPCHPNNFQYERAETGILFDGTPVGCNEIYCFWYNKEKNDWEWVNEKI